MDKKTTIILTLILLATAAQAARIGVVVTYPDGSTTTQCVRANTGTDGYKTLEQTSLDITWSEAGPWGHGLCGIEGTGCPADNCYCNSEYWGFMLAEHGDSSWNYMPVGFDAPSECWNHDYNSYVGHYCAADGDVIGLSYGTWGTEPEFVKFTDICGPELKRSAGTRRVMTASFETETPGAGEPIEITVSDNNTSEGVKKVKVGVYDGVPGASKKLFEGETDEQGKTSFTIQHAGQYRIRLSHSKYPQEYLELSVAGKPPEMTSTIEETTSLPETTVPTTLASTTTVAQEPSQPQTTVEAATSTIKLVPPKPESSVYTPPTGFVVSKRQDSKTKSVAGIVVLLLALVAATFAATRRR